jgi:hypothetical protein
MESRVEVCDQIIDRADEYARAIILACGIPVTRELMQAVSGAMLTFLADATVLAEQVAPAS